MPPILKTPLLTQGLILLACLALLAPSMAAPAPTFDPITAASFTAAGGLVCILDMTQCRILGKFEYTGGPIFKVVLEC